MHNNSYGNEFNLLVNEISFSYERMSRLALRKKLKEIRKWPIVFKFEVTNMPDCIDISKRNFIDLG